MFGKKVIFRNIICFNSITGILSSQHIRYLSLSSSSSSCGGHITGFLTSCNRRSSSFLDESNIKWKTRNTITLHKQHCMFQQQQKMYFGSSSNNNNNNKSDETEFKPVPKIPHDAMKISFTTSQGPGGQNVNKVATKAEIRIHIDSCDFISNDVKERLKTQQMTKINKAGELIVTSQTQRSQYRNKVECIEKLQNMVKEAFIEPKEREMWEGIGKITKERRKKDKRHRSEVKANRSKNRRDDF